jgi:Tol biopolymer transport system component
MFRLVAGGFLAAIVFAGFDGDLSGALPFRADRSDERAIAAGVSAASGTIIFQANREQHVAIPDLFTVAAIGGPPRPLAGEHFHGTDPAYSPDGRWLAFGQWLSTNEDRDGRWGNSLAIARSDGSAVRVVVPVGSDPLPFRNFPLWSFDGRDVAYQKSGPGTPQVPLYVVSSGGGKTRRLRYPELTRWASRGAGYAAYQRLRDVYGVAWFEPGHAQQSDYLPDARQPVWSPKPREFAYLVGREVFVFDTTSKRSHRVANNGCLQPTRAAWSPDGQWLAYFSCAPAATAFGASTLWIVSRDGVTRRVVVRTVWGGRTPSWRR